MVCLLVATFLYLPTASAVMGPCEISLLGVPPKLSDEVRMGFDARTGLAAVTTIARREALGPRKLLVFSGAGPGLSGLTLKQFYRLKDHFDLAFLLPPGTFETTKIDFANIGRVYDAHIGAFLEVIRRSIRTKTQPVVLIGHSFGGLQFADVALENAKLPIHSRINIEGLVLINSPISKHMLEDVIPEHRYQSEIVPDGADESELLRIEQNRYRNKFWNEIFSRYKDNPSEANYKQLLLAYKDIIWGDLSGSNKDAFQIVTRFRVSPTAFLFVKRHWERRGLTLIEKLRNLNIKKIGLLGYRDQLMPFDLSEREYRDAGIIPLKVENGSHFCFLDAPIFCEFVIKVMFQGLDFVKDVLSERDQASHEE